MLCKGFQGHICDAWVLCDGVAMQQLWWTAAIVVTVVPFLGRVDPIRQRGSERHRGPRHRQWLPTTMVGQAGVEWCDSYPCE